MFKKVAFTMYPVEDLERARAFYENTLKLPLSKISAGGGWIEYDLPGGGCLAITNMVPELTPSANAGGTIAFEVDALDDLVERLKKDGVKFKLDTYISPVCKMAVILDSEGNSVILHQLHPKS